MAADDWVAGIMGALGGAAQGMDAVRARKLQEEELRRRAEQQALDNAIRLRQVAGQERQEQRLEDNDLRTLADKTIEELGPGTLVTEEQDREWTRLGRGHRVGSKQVTNDPLNLEGIGIPTIPSVTGERAIVPTAAQEATRTDALGKARTQFNEKATAQRVLSSLPEHLRLPAEAGKLPTYGDAWQTPEERAAEEERKRLQDRADEQWKMDYSHGQSVSRLRLSDTLQRGRESGRGATGRAMLSGDANQMADLNDALSELSDVERALTSTQAATGTSAAVGAALPNAITELTGLGSGAKQRQATIDRVKQIIGKTMEGGVLRKEDEEKYTRILPTIGDTPEVAQAKITGLRAQLERKWETRLEALAAAGYETSRFQREGGAPAGGATTTGTGRGATGGVAVTAPNGATYTFPSEEAAEEFRRRVGGR